MMDDESGVAGLHGRTQSDMQVQQEAGSIDSDDEDVDLEELGLHTVEAEFSQAPALVSGTYDISICGRWHWTAIARAQQLLPVGGLPAKRTALKQVVDCITCVKVVVSSALYGDGDKQSRVHLDGFVIGERSSQSVNPPSRASQQLNRTPGRFTEDS
jgi:hypothetical protein